MGAECLLAKPGTGGNRHANCYLKVLQGKARLMKKSALDLVILSSFADGGRQSKTTNPAKV